ncbi:hypothetical protein HANVADRAFT_51256 [Hanseniaspora valbyensis NRRL Y-1626]|uniref:CUE domain-containing protein n=1 Tax=Hanseniaspora valbyensis NRRL Y-1626 TaxID=766949 RepID=A0A1B7TJE0_9ASCO|nr:hypothetical protein HANVADRAFT_51256 [Hanseniaspora valbyensis NRRL Y-1626]
MSNKKIKAKEDFINQTSEPSNKSFHNNLYASMSNEKHSKSLTRITTPYPTNLLLTELKQYLFYLITSDQYPSENDNSIIPLDLFLISDSLLEEKYTQKFKDDLKNLTYLKNLSFLFNLNNISDFLSLFRPPVIDFPFEDKFIGVQTSRFNTDHKKSIPLSIIYYSNINQTILQHIESILSLFFIYFPEQKIGLIEVFAKQYKIIFQNIQNKCATESTLFSQTLYTSENFSKYNQIDTYYFKIIEIFVNIYVSLDRSLSQDPQSKTMSVLLEKKNNYNMALEFMHMLKKEININSWILYNLPLKYFFEFFNLYFFITKNQFENLSNLYRDPFLANFFNFVKDFILEITEKTSESVSASAWRNLLSQKMKNSYNKMYFMNPKSLISSNENTILQKKENSRQDGINVELQNTNLEDQIEESDQAEEVTLDEMINHYKHIKNLNSSKTSSSYIKTIKQPNIEESENLLQNDLIGKFADGFEEVKKPTNNKFEDICDNEIIKTDSVSKPLTTYYYNDDIPTVEVISLQYFKKMRRLALNLLVELFPLLSKSFIKSQAVKNYWQIDSTIISLKFETEKQIQDGLISQKSLTNYVEEEIQLSFEECIIFLKPLFPAFSDSDISSLLIQNDYNFEKTFDVLTKASNGDLDVLLPFIEMPSKSEDFESESMGLSELFSTTESTKETLMLNGDDDDYDKLEDYKPYAIEIFAQIQQASNTIDPVSLLQALFPSLNINEIQNVCKSHDFDDSFVELALKLQYPNSYIVKEEEIECEEKVTKMVEVQEEIEVPVNLQEIETWKDVFPQLSYLDIKRSWYKASGDTDLMLMLLQQHLENLPENSDSSPLLDEFDEDEIEVFENKKEAVLSSVYKKYSSELKVKKDVFSGKVNACNIKDSVVYKSLKKKINAVKRFGVLTNQYAEYCLEANKYHVGNALLFAILGYDSCEKELEKHFYNLKNNKALANRVKLFFYKASRKEQNKSFDILIKPSIVPFTKKKISVPKIKAFMYILHNLPDLKKINIEFSKKAFLYFNGDETKTIALLLLFSKMNFVGDINKVTKNMKSVDIGLEFINNKNTEDDITVPLKDTIVKNNPVISIVKTKKIIKKRIPIIREFKYSSSEIKKMAGDMVKDLFINYRIDVQEFMLLEAIFFISNITKIWWSEELKQRETNYKNQELVNSKSCQYVSSLKIITGKDIDNNDTGRSLFRKKCKEFLIYNGYLVLDKVEALVLLGRVTK